MNRTGNITGSKDREDGTRRIGSASLISVCKGPIHQRLVGEIELRRPIGGKATRPLLPVLIHHCRDGISISLGDQFTWNIDKVLLIIGPTQSACELQIA